MNRKTKCLNKRCNHKTTEDKLIEVKFLKFDFYDMGITKYTDEDKDNPWRYLVCPKCKHSHYFY